mmetsp:Transcript_56049/g.112341  ORF Transcript_56049/g.112341 Transcript_56049/m.112341 type:complete len:110 (-) Transcript_56049:240-569(-)
MPAVSGEGNVLDNGAQRPSGEDRLLVGIDGYLVDLTDFVDHHPGSKAKILEKRAKSLDISGNFLDHFGRTVSTFRAATKEFEASRGEKPVTFAFKERPNAPVTIVGRMK